MRFRSWVCALGLVAFLATTIEVRADFVVNATNTPFVVNFDTNVPDVNAGIYQGQGFNSSPSAGQLDSDSWAVTDPGGGGNLGFGGSQSFGSVYAQGSGNGGIAAAGIWALNVNNGIGPANWTLGFQPSSSVFYNTGSITLKVKNTTGAPVTSWAISYDLYTFNDKGNSDTIDFWYGTSYSTDHSSFTNANLNYTSTAAASGASWSAALTKSKTLAVTVPNNGNLFLRWDIGVIDFNAGAYDELGLDNIMVTAAVAVPEANAFVLGCVVCGLVGLGRGAWTCRCKLRPSGI